MAVVTRRAVSGEQEVSHMQDRVRFEVADGVGTITLDSPANRNALSRQVRQELRGHLQTAATSDAVRVVVLTHSGPVFCSGMDLKESRGGAADAQGVNDLPVLLRALQQFPKPVVARLAGPARAGGVGLVAACDFAIVVDSATFAFSEVRLGLVPAVISIPVLPRLLPRPAHELFLTGETFDAARAAGIGLVTCAVPADRLDDEVRRHTDMLLAGAPGALSATKRLLAQRNAAGLAERYAAMSELSAIHFASREGQEGMRAFAEKRAPVWAIPSS
jgi:methylglutaconyl-CoA hydratase